VLYRHDLVGAHDSVLAAVERLGGHKIGHNGGVFPASLAFLSQPRPSPRNPMVPKPLLDTLPLPQTTQRAPDDVLRVAS